jgi:hypothetical protein
MLSCPPNGCPSNQVCYQTNCCSPVNNCGNQCGVSVSDNCGGSISCSCSSGVCYQGACCTRSGCGGNCMNNCGQQDMACCDAGGPPPDAGCPYLQYGQTCIPAGEPCCAPYMCLAADLPLIVRFIQWLGGAGGGGGPDGGPPPIDGGPMPDAGTTTYTCH